MAKIYSKNINEQLVETESLTIENKFNFDELKQDLKIRLEDEKRLEQALASVREGIAQQRERIQKAKDLGIKSKFESV